MKHHLLDAGVVLAYLLAMLTLGWRLSRRQTSTEVYFVARRSIPPWAVGLSTFATLISSITFIAYPGSGYAGNWSELVPGMMVLIVLALIGTVVIPFYREAVGVSAYEYFGRRFGYGVRAYAGLAFIAGHFSKMGFVLYLMALTASSMTGWNLYVLLVGIGLVTLMYTWLGGLEAVIWTDVIQGLLMWIGALVVLGLLLSMIPGGPEAAVAHAAQADKFELGHWRFDPADARSFWVMALYGFFWYLQKYGADQTIVQRYLVARTHKEAFRGIALGAALCVPIWTLFMFLGTLLWSYYELTGQALPASLHDATGQIQADKVFPYFLTTHLPDGLAGLFIAALLGAGMSTLSSDLNCLAAVGVEDYYRRLRPDASDSARLQMGRLIVLAAGVLATSIAALIAWRGDRVLAFYYAVTSIVSGGLAGLFLLAFLSRRANRRGVWIGLGTNLLFTAWAVLTRGSDPWIDLGTYNYPWSGVMIGILGHFIVWIVGYLASLCFPADPGPAWTVWTWRAGQYCAKEPTGRKGY
ncbi:MAG: sodium:solute symporter [Verrucomicrobiota bacterium]|nr:sodium:solute symporter [Limisphaera sp.]MDW8382110.1 sodium:solute symporter [Verrucomicrobiota bacterium]